MPCSCQVGPDQLDQAGRRDPLDQRHDAVGRADVVLSLHQALPVGGIQGVEDLLEVGQDRPRLPQVALQHASGFMRPELLVEAGLVPSRGVVARDRDAATHQQERLGRQPEQVVRVDAIGVDTEAPFAMGLLCRADEPRDLVVVVVSIAVRAALLTQDPVDEEAVALERGPEGRLADRDVEALIRGRIDTRRLSQAYVDVAMHGHRFDEVLRNGVLRPRVDVVLQGGPRIRLRAAEVREVFPFCCHGFTLSVG